MQNRWRRKNDLFFARFNSNGFFLSKGVIFMGKKEPSVFEKQIRKVRRIKNILIVTVVALFLGFNGYVGYSVYSIYSTNDIVTQATTNNATVTLTVTPTDIGRFIFDQLDINTTLGSGEIPLTMLFGGFGGSNDSENQSSRL
jgi:hypothetical protein